MKTDIDRMIEFDSEVLDYLLRQAGEKNPEPNPEFFKDDRNILLVSRTDGHLSGFLWAYVLLRPDKNNSMMLLYSIDVFEPYRRKGIATLLIRHLKEIARAHNCFKMFLQADKNNPAAVALYSGTGGVPNQGEGVTFTYDREALDE